MSIPSVMAHPLRRISGWFRDAVFHTLLQNAGMLLGGKVVASALGVLTTMVKTRALGAEQFGLLAVIMAYAALIERLTTFQPWLALIKYGAEALEQARHDEFMGQVKLSVLLDLVGAVSGTAIAAAGAYIFANWQGWGQEVSRMASVFSISILFHLAGTPIGVLRLLDRFDLLTAQNVITSGVSLVGSTVVYAMGGGIWGFLVLLLLSSLLSSLLMWGMAFTAMRERGLAAHWRAPVGKWKPFVRFSMWRYLSSAFDIPVKQLDVIIVSTVISLEATGIYRIIKQVLGVLGLWTGPVYQAVFPQFATMIAKRDNEGAIKYAVKIGVLSFASVGLPAVMLAVTSTWWLDMVFGAGFAAGAAPLSVFLFFQVFAIGATVIHPLFTAMGYVKQNSVILLLANATYLGLAWQLSKAWGLSGLGLAFGVQLSLIVVLKAVYIARRQSSGVPVA